MQPFKHTQTILQVTSKEVLRKLEEILPANKFTILHVHDVASTLQEKGFNIEPYYIVEFCRAPAAYKVLGEDPDIGLFLPCKFLLIQQGTDVRVTSFLPTAIATFFPKTDLATVAQEVEKDLLIVMAQLTF